MGRLDEDYALLLENVSTVQAGLASNLLESAGIPSFTDDLTQLVSAYIATSFAARVRLFVRHEDLDKAQVLLEKVWEEGGDEEPAGEV